MRGAIAITVAIAAAPSPAYAETRWYGEQVLGTDALSWALLGAALKAEEAGPAIAGVATYVVGGPIVHLAHENFGRAGISLSMRTAAPILGAAIGSVIDRNPEHDPSGLVVGLLIGWVGAQIVDIAVIASDEVRAPATAPHMISIG